MTATRKFTYFLIVFSLLLATKPVFASTGQMTIDPVVSFLTSPAVVTILIVLAVFGLVLEMFSPGFGIAGILSVIGFTMFFVSHMLAGIANGGYFVLFIIGFSLLLLELVVPGGIIGIIGGACMIVALLLTGESITYMAYSIILAMFIALVGMVVLIKMFGKKLHVFNKLVLKDATTTEEGYISNESRVELVGKIAVTQTAMRPAGVILIEDERIDAVSEGSFIDKDKQVEVIKAEGSRIVVRERV